MPNPNWRPWLELNVLLHKDEMTIRHLASLTTLSEAYWYDLRIGRRRPTPRAIAEAARALKVPKWMLEPGTEEAA